MNNMAGRDVSNLSNTPQLNMAGMIPNEMSSNTQVLWGTNINTGDLSMKLRDFLTTFTLSDEEFYGPNGEDN